jgi:hypothetical protein
MLFAGKAKWWRAKRAILRAARLDPSLRKGGSLRMTARLRRYLIFLDKQAP